jgi:hypothetical protein
MAVIANVSVGDIFYYLVDDFPTHSAPKGSVSILNGGQWEGRAIWVNNNGSDVWVKSISDSYGEMYISDNTTTIDFDSQTDSLTPPYSWYSWTAADSYTEGDVFEYVKFTDATFGDALRYTGDTLSRVIVTQMSTNRGGTGKWMGWRFGPAKNFTIPTQWNEAYANDNAATTSCGSVRLLEMNENDSLVPAISPIQREGGGGAATRSWIPKHTELVVNKVDEALKRDLFSEDWESSGFTENSWTVVNGTTNVWVVGQAQNNGGTSSSYVSDDGGASASYTITTATVSHFYKDFVIPNNSTVYLQFDWKCQGENAGGVTQYDYGAVVITTTGTTPVAGTEVTTTQTDGAATTRIGAEDNDGKFNLNYGTNPGTTWNTETIDLSAYAGETKRLVFTWKNDGSVGTDPPFIVDNIKIIEYKF